MSDTITFTEDTFEVAGLIVDWAIDHGASGAYITFLTQMNDSWPAHQVNIVTPSRYLGVRAGLTLRFHGGEFFVDKP